MLFRSDFYSKNAEAFLTLLGRNGNPAFYKKIKDSIKPMHKFELSMTDIGKLAIALVDAATIVIGTSTVHIGPHPNVFSITRINSIVRPKLHYN